MVSGVSLTFRVIGALICAICFFKGYAEYNAGTFTWASDPLIGFLGGVVIFFTPSLNPIKNLQKLLPRSTSEDEQTVSDTHNRQAMLKFVRHSWVEGVLEQSLHEEARIELGLSELVERPLNMTLQTPDRSERALSPGTKVVDVFEKVGRSLLILGEPGSGKTTSLLELAKEMIDRAEKDASEKIPVVFNLSSWTDPAQTMVTWLIEELRVNYNVPKKIATSWIENDALMPLLDGLDEVAKERRKACVEAINGYLGEHMVPVAVCCRKEEYDALNTKLNIQSAVLIQPLTSEQIDGYLDKLSPNLDSLRDVLKSDHELLEFAKTPLILSIMTFAYRNVPVEELQLRGSIADRHEHLFKTYMDKMFERDTPRTDLGLYSKEDTIHWLSWLARKMMENNQTVFLIERMQPGLMETKAQQRLYSILVALAGGLAFGLLGLIYISANDLGPTEFKNLSRDGKLKQLMSGLAFGLPFGLAFGLAGWLAVAVTFNVVGPMGIEIETTELKLSLGNVRRNLAAILASALLIGLVFGLLVGPAFGLVFGLMRWRMLGLAGGLAIGLASALAGGLAFGMMSGGIAVVQHYSLRFVLNRENLLPWNLVSFLDYATERIFLRKVGGGYLFIHRMLIRYLANQPELIDPLGGGNTDPLPPVEESYNRVLQ